MAIVFQYGSNSLNSEINSPRRLCDDARFLDIAETLEEFELAFDVWSKRRECATADIVRKPGGKVWGVLYEVPDYLIARDTAKLQDRKSFDAIEGEGTKLQTRNDGCATPRRTGGQGPYLYSYRAHCRQTNQ